ncbi:unnamed protein product [Hydatigera taeniaeformis]|uniref:CNH domain-containing protein n=1 Tax=Hydatigena taeniaeformis TaxID=6205 RepID=A0A0R3X2C9_HYDTA|nr:unnamed protein product [Hydatigera taeniaeformis]
MLILIYRLIGPTGPASGVALLVGGKTGVEVVMRAGSLRNFNLKEGGTSLVQLQALFHDTSEVYRLRILRDLRLLLAVPSLEDNYFSTSQQWRQHELDTPCKNPQFRVFKPLKFTPEGSLVCVAFPQSENTFTAHADSIVLRSTGVGLLVSHFASDVPLSRAVLAVERLKLFA